MASSKSAIRHFRDEFEWHVKRSRKLSINRATIGLLPLRMNLALHNKQVV